MCLFSFVRLKIEPCLILKLNRTVKLKTAIVILNYNTRKLLQQFLPVVLQHSKAAQVIVADNGSTDDSVACMKSEFSEVRLICNNVNGGFAAGYNQCLKQVQASYILLLNSDVLVTENWIEPLQQYLDDHPEVAAVQPKLKDFKKRDKFEFAGASGGFIDYLGFPFCRGRIFDTIEKDNGQYDNEMEVFWATGACMLIRKNVFDTLGGFDEMFFAHMEEIDLCWRIQNAGYKLMVVPQSVVYHVGGGTLSVMSPRKTYLNFRNNLLMLHKNLPGHLLYVILFFKMTLDGVASIKFLFDNGWQHFIAVFKAHIFFYTNFIAIQHKRKQTQSMVKAHNRQNIYKHSIVWMYFIKSKKRFETLPGF